MERCFQTSVYFTHGPCLSNRIGVQIYRRIYKLPTIADCLLQRTDTLPFLLVWLAHSTDAYTKLNMDSPLQLVQSMIEVLHHQSAQENAPTQFQQVSFKSNNSIGNAIPFSICTSLWVCMCWTRTVGELSGQNSGEKTLHLAY